MDGLRGSDLRLHDSSQKMQCNLKSNGDTSEWHSLFRAGGSLFDLPLLLPSALYVSFCVHEEIHVLWHLMVTDKSSSRCTWSSS